MGAVGWVIGVKVRMGTWQETEKVTKATVQRVKILILTQMPFPYDRSLIAEQPSGDLQWSSHHSGKPCPRPP